MRVCYDTDLVSVVERFLAWLRSRNLAEATVTTRRDGLRRLVRFAAGTGRARFQDFTPDALADFANVLKAEGLSEHAVDGYLRSARALFTWLAETGGLFENPFASFRMPKKSRRLPRVPSEEAVRRLLAAPDLTTPRGLRDRAVVEVFYSTGVRLEELCRLDLQDVDLRGRTLRVKGKGRRERMPPLGETCRERLAEYLERGRPRLARPDVPDRFALWIGSTRGLRLGKQAVEHVLKRLSRTAGLDPPITPHDLRRAMATHMLQNGASPIHIQFLLGHATLRHLSQYLKLTITDIKAMHEATKVGK